MGRAFRSVWQGITTFYDELFPFIGMNLIWLLPTALITFILTTIYLIGFGQPTVGSTDDPGSFFAFIAVMAFLVIAPNPASAGIHYYANQKANDEIVEFSFFWTGLRLYWKKALVLFLISVAGTSLLVVNIVFYFGQENDFLRVLAMVFVWILVLWLMMQMYMIPLLVEQTSKGIRLILKNAAILTLGNPGFTIVLFILLLIITFASILVPVLVALLTGALVAIIEERAVLTLIERYRARSQA